MRKHSFHCQTCGKECTIYKKGKKHRVLVCPQCGVLATNPIVNKNTVGYAGLGATLGSAFLPGIGTAVGAGSGAIVAGLMGDGEQKTTSPSTPTMTHTHRTIFDKALMLEYLEKTNHRKNKRSHYATC